MLRNLSLSIASLLVTLALLEVGIRSHDALRSGQPFLRTTGNVLARPMARVAPFRTFGFDPYRTSGSERFISSRWGEIYFYTKAPGTYRIVCLGGSTTENRVDGVHYPLLLEALLRERLHRGNIEVINAGNSAYATPHLIILLALDVASWEPDLIIVSENVNDLLAMYWPGFRPDYWHKYRDRYYTAPDYSTRYSWSNVVFQHSRLYWFVRNAIEPEEQRSGRSSAPLRRQHYGDLPLPEAADVYRRNLQTLVAIAARWKIQTIIGTQPLQPSEEFFLRHMRYKQYNDVVVYPYHEEFLRHHQAFNTIAEEVARSTGVGFVDNAAKFGGDARYFTDFVHYTKEGLRLLAGSYADYVIAHNMIGRARER